MRPKRQRATPGLIGTTAHGDQAQEVASTRMAEKINAAMVRGIKRLESGNPGRRGGLSVRDLKRIKIGKAVNLKKQDDAALVDSMIANRPLFPPGRKP